MTHPRPWLPYCAPFFLYLGFLLLQSRLPAESLLYMYPVRALAVGAALVYFWKYYDELRVPQRPVTTYVWAIGIGLLAIVIWIAIDPFYPKLGQLMTDFSLWLGRLFGFAEPPATPPPPPFDPTTIESPVARFTFIGFRIFGAAVVVAYMEELFWRGFLIRWLIREDFKSVAVGAFTGSSFLITVLFFGAEHEQWLAGILCGILYNLLYYRTRDIFACVLAHAVSNAALAAYVLATGDWKFW